MQAYPCDLFGFVNNEDTTPIFYKPTLNNSDRRRTQIALKL